MRPHILEPTSPPAHLPGSTQTINLVQRDLPKDLQVRPVEHTAENPLQTAIVGVQQGLSRHTVGHKPHAQEKEEEEDILHLQGDEGHSHGWTGWELTSRSQRGLFSSIWESRELTLT